MKLKLNNYKITRLKHFIKTIKLSVFCHVTSLNAKNWLKVKQFLIYETLNFQRLYNILIKNIIHKSVFKNFIGLINGSIFCINIQIKKDFFFFLKKFLKINSELTILCIRINNRMYSIVQFINIKNLNYIFNIFKLYKVFKNLLTILFKKIFRVFRNSVI